MPHVPDSISIETFMWDESSGRHPLAQSQDPFTDGLTARSYSASEVKERIDHLARGLCKEFGWAPDQGSEWDKVIGIFSLNTIDYVPLTWATHRLGGVATCANAAYNAHELEYQLRDSGAKAVFTCLALLETTLAAAKKCNIPKERVYILPMAPGVTQGVDGYDHKTLEDIVIAGSKQPPLQASDKSWKTGEGARRTAYLCYSSGTSGLPKGVMISHRNVIANTLQMVTHETPSRAEYGRKNDLQAFTETALGLLPMSHIYGLVVGSHAGAYRGDGVIVLPKYDFKILLQTIQDYKINMLYLVPPMIIHMTKARDTVKQYDLSSVRACFTGAAPLGKETADDLLSIFPDWAVRQGYGLTETSTVVCSTVPDDIWFGSSGPLLPGIKARLVTVEGNEITGYNQPGELWVQSPAVVLGYLNNPTATRETFVDESDGRYMRTGDEAIIAKSPNGHEHVIITDRIKEYFHLTTQQRDSRADHITQIDQSQRPPSSKPPPPPPPQYKPSTNHPLPLGPSRTRSPPPHPPRRKRLRRHRHPLGPRRRSAQSLRRQNPRRLDRGERCPAETQYCQARRIA